jgi:hypothetical protein
MNARLQIVHPAHYTAVVSPWGFDMECDYSYDPGESANYDLRSNPAPGTPANAELIACRVGSIDITEMVSLCQREFIEEKLIEQMEGM